MATGDSVIRVSIIGDAKKLNSAVKSADKGVSKLGASMKNIGLAIGALGAVKIGVDFAQGAIAAADQAGDAVQTLDRIIGKVNAKKLDDISESFVKIGLSSPDFLTMAATFAAFARGAGIGQKAITRLADDVVSLAQALSFSDPKGRSAAEMLGLLDKAATGAPKALRELGIRLNESAVKLEAMRHFGLQNEKQITAGMLAQSRYTLILRQLHPEIDKVANSTGDLEIEQARLDATVKNLQEKLGGPLSAALAGVLKFILDEIDALPAAIAGWSQLGAAVEGFARTALAPIGNVNDAINGLNDLIMDVAFNLTHIGQNARNAAGEARILRELQNNELRNGQGRP